MLLARLLLAKLPLPISSSSSALSAPLLSKLATGAVAEPATKRVKLNCIHPVPSDIDIAHASNPLHISRIATSLGLTEDDYDCYGKTMAKVRSRRRHCGSM